jgi:hypothetical protein
MSPPKMSTLVLGSGGGRAGHGTSRSAGPVPSWVVIR